MECNEIQILVIDDVQAIRVQVRHLLTSTGFRNVTLAEDGVVAKRFLAEHQYQLIICDWHMTPIDGMALLRFVREHALHFDTPFIMLTAEDTKEKVIEAIASGIDDFLIKPLTLDKLNTRVEALLKRKKVLT